MTSRDGRVGARVLWTCLQVCLCQVFSLVLSWFLYNFIIVRTHEASIVVAAKCGFA